MNHSQQTERASFFRRFLQIPSAVFGLAAAGLMILLAVYAPLLANSAPLLILDGGTLSSPALKNLFSDPGPEILIERLFNFLLFFLPLLLILRLFPGKVRCFLLPVASVALAAPFFFLHTVPDRTEWAKEIPQIRARGGHVLSAPVRFGPYETAASPYGKITAAHPMGTDHAGRDVAARMIFGARVSASVGFLATALAMAIGTMLGMFAGYRGGKTDLVIMRFVEIVICFPQFLLLLILMSILLDSGSRQSLLLLIGVIGLLGWTGLCRLVRAETLKQRAMAYIPAAESLGVPTYRILFRHLLPNVSGPLFVTFSFAVAGAILEESFLSFLGFGVQEPTASWGELMRQAFPDPVTYWNLTLWPGLAVFLAVCAFNFIGEGLRKTLAP